MRSRAPYPGRVRPSRRAALALTVALSPLGTIAGHVAGYGAAGRDADLDTTHAHLRPGLWLAAVAAVAALAWVATSRRAGSSRPRLAWLAGGQVAAFVVLEAAERVAGGHGAGGLLADRAFRWGVAAQAAAAAALVVGVALARATGERVRAALASRRTLPSPEPSVPARPGHRPLPTAGLDRSSVTERGPPGHLAFA